MSENYKEYCMKFSNEELKKNMVEYLINLLLEQTSILDSNVLIYVPFLYCMTVFNFN